MLVQVEIPYEKLIELAEQLPLEQQRELVNRLQKRLQPKALTVEEKMKLLREAQVDVQVIQEPSIRREDWYDDDGR